MEDEAATSSLPPGFRFHPTDEEIVSYYLKRKVCGKPFRFDAVSEVDLYKCEPWDLPGKSRLKSRDLEWYFFVVLDKKYGNGGTRTNRATDQGYWKTTGKDRPVRRNNRIVGMKKTLVFHIGRAPRGERTNWVTHEYRLVDEELEKAGIVQDAYVMCRIFQKSGSGPRNGEQYGAPFIDEEWDESVMVPKCEDDAIFYVGNEGNVQRNNLEQNIDKGIPSEIVPVQFPLNFDRGDSFNHSNESRGFLNDGQKLFIGVGEKSDLPEPFDSQKFLDLPEQYQMDPPPVKDGCFVELDDLVTPVVGNYHAANPVDEELKYFDASHSLLADDGSFVEINDLQNPVEADPSGFEMLNEYLSYFDAVDNNLQFALPDSSKILDIENPILDQPAFTQEVRSGIGETFLAGPQPLKPQGGVGASSSQQESNSTKLTSEVQYNEGADNTLAKRLSRMLGSIPAPPAFAEEFPAKEAAFGQNPAMHSLGSIHVTTGMIHVSGMTLRSSRKDGSLGKREDVGVHLSYDMTRVDMMAAEQLIGNSVGFEPVANILSGKAGSVTVRFGFYQIFFWVLILSVSFKIGSYIYTS